MQISAKTVSLGNKKIKFTALDDIAEVKVGLQTGDNPYYLYKDKDALGSYKIIDETKVLTEKEISKIQNDEKLRSKITEFGISKNMFNGKTIIPHDKGGSSDIDAGRLNNYYSEPEFFIDYSKDNVTRLKTLTIADRKRYYGEKNIRESDEGNVVSRFQNIEYYFKKGITFPMTGLYSPTYKLNSSSVFGHGGNCLFIKEKYKNLTSHEFLLGIICSKLEKYFIKVYANNSVNTGVEDVKKNIIPICDKSQKQEIEKLVKEIIKKQKKDPDYNYQNHEQIEIDKLVYEIFGLDQELIDEVETWYARRYPKLVRN